MSIARRLIATFMAAFVVTAAAVVEGKTFFRPHEATKSTAARPPGVHSGAAPVTFNVSEMLSLVPGEEVELNLPNATSHAVIFEKALSHVGEIRSWIGHFIGRGKSNRVIVTSGSYGSYGVIETPDGTFRILPGDAGHDWLVEMNDEERFLPPPAEADDQRIPPTLPKTWVEHEPTFLSPEPGGLEVKSHAATAQIDVMVVVTQGLADKLGANLMTRLQFLVTRANQSYHDSGILMSLRLVRVVVVAYPDSTDVGDALDAITPFAAGGTGVFANVEAERNAAGADMVSLMLDGGTLAGNGIAWVGGVVPNPTFMYSVVKGCTGGCESVWIHELGHNMGNKHDRYTDAWQEGPPPNSNYFGPARPFAYGYAFCISGTLTCNPVITNPPDAGNCTQQPECSTNDASNFRDIMAYFQGSTRELYRFSNASQNDCRSPQAPSGAPFRACGVVAPEIDSADAAQSMNAAAPLISALKSASNPARISNISTRMQVLTGNDVMIAGFIVGGSTPKTVVINVAGPHLQNFGITNALGNPTLTLVRSADQAVIATNDDWQGAANAAAIQASGFAPNHPLEPAIMMTLAPGAYTAIVQGNGGTTGVGLVGVFEVDNFETPLINISTRGQVLTGNDVMIAGFIIQGDGPQTVVVNVAGPHLANFGIANFLANPTLTLVRSADQAVIATNDNWQTAGNSAEIQSSGFAPNNPLEPAIMMTLAPGAYTAIVQGAGGTTGVGLVGVFRVP